MKNHELKEMVSQIGTMATQMQESVQHDPQKGLVTLAMLVANLAGAFSLYLSEPEAVEETPRLTKETKGAKSARS